ncbi:hypothetical protein GCM10027031_14110 [Corynebacterium atrinae]
MSATPASLLLGSVDAAVSLELEVQPARRVTAAKKAAAVAPALENNLMELPFGYLNQW